MCSVKGSSHEAVAFTLNTVCYMANFACKCRGCYFSKSLWTHLSAGGWRRHTSFNARHQGMFNTIAKASEDLLARTYVLVKVVVWNTLCLLRPYFLQELIKTLLIQQSDKVKDSKQEEEQDDWTHLMMWRNTAETKGCGLWRAMLQL